MSSSLPRWRRCSKPPVTDDPQKNPAKRRTLEITPRERQLLLKYGYPFQEAEEALRNSRAVSGFHRVQIGAYWIDMMLADLSRSAREIRGRALLEEIDALCCVLEAALNDHPLLHD